MYGRFGTALNQAIRDVPAAHYSGGLYEDLDSSMRRHIRRKPQRENRMEPRTCEGRTSQAAEQAAAVQRTWLREPVFLWMIWTPDGVEFSVQQKK
ncbi:MAG: hypothetical protein MK110_00875 [Fuerstiella sp.]|nr:hypothetical protein [Fuerstiella sp.]